MILSALVVGMDLVWRKFRDLFDWSKCHQSFKSQQNQIVHVSG